MDDLSRRAFLAAAGVAALGRTVEANAPIDGKLLKDLPEPVQIPPAPDRKVGFAVVGLGRLSVDQILPALRTTEHAKLVALVTGHPDEKGKPLARRYGVDEKAIYTYDTYDQMKNNPEIEAVYVVLPNAQHPEYTIRAAQAGKHVLCEKPMANTAADCQRMVDASKAAGKLLMVAYRLQFEPLTLLVKKMVSDKTLGKVKVINATNCQNERRGKWRTDRALGGFGALSDIGIYCLNTTRFILGEEPVNVLAYGYSTPADERFGEGMFETISWTMRFPSGAILNAMCSFGAGLKFYALGGEQGSGAIISQAYGYHGQKLQYQTRGAPATDGRAAVPSGLLEPSVPDIDQFAREMDEFALAIKQNRPVSASGEEGLRDLRYMEAIQKSAEGAGLITF